MTNVAVNELTTAALHSVPWLGAGLLIGGAYFLLLNWNVRLLASGRRLALAAALPLGRFAALAVTLVVTVKFAGAWPLAFVAFGIAIARLIALRLHGRAGRPAS